MGIPARLRCTGPSGLARVHSAHSRADRLWSPVGPVDQPPRRDPSRSATLPKRRRRHCAAPLVVRLCAGERRRLAAFLSADPVIAAAASAYSLTHSHSLSLAPSLALFLLRNSPRSPFHIRYWTGGREGKKFVYKLYRRRRLCVHAGDPIYTRAEQWKSRESRILQTTIIYFCVHRLWSYIYTRYLNTVY